MRALLVYPTHRNLAEEHARYESAGHDAAVYPTRTTQGTQLQEINCWNEDADRAEAAGFPVGRTVCLRCQHRGTCLQEGYLQQVIAADEADVALATHARLEYTGFTELGQDRDYVSIHEDPVRLLNPTLTIDQDDVQRVREKISLLLSDPKWLDWFGESTSKDDDGNEYDDEQKQVRRERYYQATGALVDLLDELLHAIESTQQTAAWEPTRTIPIPNGFEQFLWWYSKIAKLHVREAPWRFLLAALAGELQRTTIIVSERHVRGLKQGTKQFTKSVVGVRQNHPQPNKTIWFNDATLTSERLNEILGRNVIDGTPDGQIARQKWARQYVPDITRQTSLPTIVSILRGLLARYREYARVGLITHRPQLKALEKLEPHFRRRVVMSTYFGSGDERSSNAWYQDCDLLVILGTPRVPPDAIRQYLIQVGEQQIACANPVWDTVYWQVETTSGELKTIEGRGYHDPKWSAAHRDLVRAALVQAIGRGRLILENGSDVIVVSNEECGLQVIDEEIPRLNDSAVAVLHQLSLITATKSNKAYIDKVAANTASIAQLLDRPQRSVRRSLHELESLHLVQRNGPRSAWQLVAEPDCSFNAPTKKEFTHERCH